MNKSFLLTVVVALAVFPLVVKASTKPPKDIVEQFVKMDVEGARLTSQGWQEADALFVRPSEPPQPKVLLVIAWRYAVSDGPEKGNTADFYMGYAEVGRVSTSSLRPQWSPQNRPTVVRAKPANGKRPGTQ
jgi:hypothetical protein